MALNISTVSSKLSDATVIESVCALDLINYSPDILHLEKGTSRDTYAAAVTKISKLSPLTRNLATVFSLKTAKPSLCWRNTLINLALEEQQL